MSIDNRIKDALTRHESDVQARPGAWLDVERRVARSHKRRIVASGVGVALAIAAAVILVPKIGDESVEPVTPNNWERVSPVSGGFEISHPNDWTADVDDSPIASVPQVRVSPRDPKGGEAFSISVQLWEGSYDEGLRKPGPPWFLAQYPFNIQATPTEGELAGRPYVRWASVTQAGFPSGATVNADTPPNRIIYSIDWPGAPPRCRSGEICSLVVDIQADSSTTLQRYLSTAERIARTVRPTTSSRSNESASPGPEATPTLRSVQTLKGTRSDVFTGELALDPRRGFLFIGEQHELGNSAQFRVRVVDARTLRTIRIIGPGLVRLVDPVRGHVYLDQAGEAGPTTGTRPLRIFDSETGKKVAELPGDERGTPPALDQTGGRLFVPRLDGLDVYRVGDFTRVGRIETALAPESVAFGNGSLYVSQPEGPRGIHIIDPDSSRQIGSATGFETKSQGAPFVSASEGWLAGAIGTYEDSILAVHAPDGRRMWAVREGHQLISPVVDNSRGLLFTAMHDLTSTSPPIDIDDPPDVVQVRSFMSGKLLGSIRVPDGPVALAIDADNRLVYIVTLLGNTVEVIGY